MVSLYHERMKEPESVSAVAGEEKYQIPTAMFLAGSGACYYGEEALCREHQPDGELYRDLYRQALLEEECGLYHNLLAQFLERMVRLKDRFDFHGLTPVVSLTLPELTPEAVRLVSWLRAQPELPFASLVLSDYREAFYAHTYHQSSSIWLRDVALFDFGEQGVDFALLHRRGAGSLQHVRTFSHRFDLPEGLMTDEKKDHFFASVLQEALSKRVVTGVYLAGDGFDGKWMKESLKSFGTNKRVFIGKNLYTRGACYLARQQEQPEGWNLFYSCDYKLQNEICLQVQEEGRQTLLKLASAGANYFDPLPEYTLIYDGNPNVEVVLRSRGSRQAKRLTFGLEQLPERDAKTIRLHLKTIPLDGTTVELELFDEGFGELFASSGKTWRLHIDLNT